MSDLIPGQARARFVAFLLLCILLTVGGFAQVTQVVWVDVAAGRDDADGTIRSVATIKRGLELAKAIHQRGLPVVVRLRPGVYREVLTWRSVTDASVTIEAERNGEAIISGADAWESWTVDGRLLVHEWPYDWGLSPIPPGWISNGLNVAVPDIVRRRELVIVDGVRLNQTLQPGGLGVAGSFYIDEQANTITINPSLTLPVNREGTVEVGVRERVLDLQNSKNVTVRGLVFTGAASHFDAAGAVINNATDLVIEDNRFVLNGAGGLGLSRSSGASRRNVFVDNGATGWGGAYNHDLISIDDVATANNLRGALGGFYGWSVAGVKHLHQRRVEYRNLRACDNQSAGIWLDSDMEQVTLAGVVSCRNRQDGIYLEALQGAISISGSRFESNGRYGINISSVHNLTVRDTWIVDNGAAGLWVGGNVPTRSIWNHLTDKDMALYPARNVTLMGNFVGGRSEAAPALYYQTGQFEETFKPTYRAENNRWWNADGSRPFRVGNNSPQRYDLAGWQSRSGQDRVGSVMGTPVITLTPSPSPTWRGETSTPEPIVPTATATATARPPEATATPGRLVLRITGQIDVDLRVEWVNE